MTAFTLHAPDGGCHYFENADPSLFCPKCESYIGKEPYYPKSMDVRKPKYDFFACYDGRRLISEKAKIFLEKLKVEGLEFKRVNESPQFFLPVCYNIVEFDVEKRKTRFEKLCSQCGNYQYIVGATPAFLKNIKAVQADSWYRTDIEFGSGKAKKSLTIVGEKLKKTLEKEFKEIDFEAVRE
ncbi:MAG: hypothetical protein KA176_11625 [Alphaproteobacteria bacterium]|nr:hypothetical protein [Alphaproteobacteria bacterium]MBP7763211.1 hypothetical protein [Alphaproteobacteria bacterium]